MTRFRFRVALFLAGLAVSLTACGPAKPGTVEPQPQPGAVKPEAKPAAKPVVFGASLSLSGSYARNGEDQKVGYEMWVADVNKRGGILGRPVELRFYDDQSTPETGAKLYEKLITQDKVDVVLGPYSTAVTAAASTVTEKYQYVMMAPGASARNIFERGYKYSFQMMSAQLQMPRFAIELAKDQGLKTVALIGQNNAFGKEVMQGAADAAKALGLQVVFMQEYSADTKDLSSIIVKMKALNPDVVLAGAYLPDSVLLVQQIKELDFNPRMLVGGSVGPALPDYVKTLGQDADYTFGLAQWEATTKFAGNEQFVKAYQQAQNGQLPSYSVAASYQAGQIMEEAIKKVGSVDQLKLRDEVAKMSFQGPFGSFRVDEQGRQEAHEGVVIQIQNGKRVTVWPKAIAEGTVKLPVPKWKDRK